MGKRSKTDDGFRGDEVVETERFVFFWQPPGVFSQWTDSPFAVDGVEYGCAEQFMMAEKARLMGDEETRRKVLDTESPRAQKALGRRVADFDAVRWDAVKLDVVVRGNLAKFGQDDERRAALLATGTKTLVEASPYDRVWGIGLRADDPRALDPSTWRGENLLGVALGRVRDELRRG